MKIINLIDNEKQVLECAKLIMKYFKDFTDLEYTKQFVRGCINPSKISMIAVDNKNNVLGFICGIEQYNAHIWEIQPIAVNEDFHKKGIGTELIKKFEQEVIHRKGTTIILTTADANNETSIGGVDLYEDTFKKVESIKNLKNNPYEFYQKNGFKIVGVMPDVNGYGKPDIIMAKRESR